MSAMRAVYLGVYGLLAALGAALLARPALLTFRGLGLFEPALPWDVPLGGAALLLFSVLAIFTAVLAVAAALGRKPRVPEHAAFLALLAAAIGVRVNAGEPAAPSDPSPALIAGLRSAAAAADARYAVQGRYALDERALDAELSKAPPPGFRFRGRALPLRAKIVARAAGPQLAPDRGDLPGTIVVAVSPDASRLWLTALTQRGGRVEVLTSEGRPVSLQARAGTHGAPGRDPLVPAYPSMRAVGR